MVEKRHIKRSSTTSTLPVQETTTLGSTGYIPVLSPDTIQAFAEVRKNIDLCRHMLHVLIIEKGYTLEEIADIADVSVRTLLRLLNGITRKPNLIVTLTIFVLYYRPLHLMS